MYQCERVRTEAERWRQRAVLGLWHANDVGVYVRERSEEATGQRDPPTLMESISAGAQASSHDRRYSAIFTCPRQMLPTSIVGPRAQTKRDHVIATWHTLDGDQSRRWKRALKLTVPSTHMLWTESYTASPLSSKRVFVHGTLGPCYVTTLGI